MKIDSVSYSLAASHLATRHDESTESLRVWKGNRQPDLETGGDAKTPMVSLSTAALALLAADSRANMAAPPAQPERTQGGAAIEEAADAVDSDPSLMLIRSMVEMLTGHRIKVFRRENYNLPTPHRQSPAPRQPRCGKRHPPGPPASALSTTITQCMKSSNEPRFQPKDGSRRLTARKSASRSIFP